MLRAQVQLANERQSLVQSRNRAKSSLLVLARNIGMSPGTEIELADPLEFHLDPRPINLESVLPQALAARPDYQSLMRQHDALHEQLQRLARALSSTADAQETMAASAANLGSIEPTGVAQLIAHASRFLIATAMAKKRRSRRASGASSGK